MHILLRKFGDILTSREAGREAYAAFLPTLKTLGSNEQIIIDFEGVAVLAPSWADEFVGRIVQEYKVSFVNDANPSVRAALRIANPVLNLDEADVFQDAIVFKEKNADKKIFNNVGRAILIFTFPYDDEKAIRILKNNNIKKIVLHPVNQLPADRLRTVIRKLKQAGIDATVEK